MSEIFNDGKPVDGSATPEDHHVDANEAPPEQPDFNTALDKLYGKLPKIIARLRSDTSDSEILSSIKSLFSIFNKINDLEEKLLPEEKKGQHQDISFSRIYDLAGQGGAGTDIEELRQVNATFAEENSILAEAVNSLTFQIKTLRRQTIDEAISEGRAQPLSKLETALDRVGTTLIQLGKLIEQNALNEPYLSAENNIYQQFIERLADLSAISPHLLDATPDHTTFAGKILRKFGFAYDYKDFAAVKQVVAIALKSNKKLSELYQQAIPANGQVASLHEILKVIELYAGHGERQGIQYKEAMKEIQRLQEKIVSYESKQGSLDEFDTALKIRAVELAGAIAKLESTKANIEEIMKPLHDIKEENQKLIQTVEENSKIIKKITEQSERNSSRISKIEQDKQSLEEKLAISNREHRQQVAILENSMQDLKDGLLVPKLLAEIDDLRETARGFESHIDEMRTQKEALENRVETWISDPAALKEEVSKWKKRSVASWSYATAAAVVTGVGGPWLSKVPAVIAHPVPGYFATMMSVPAILAGFMALAASNDDKFENAAKAVFLGAFVGGVFSIIGIVPSVNAWLNDQEDYNRKLYQDQAHFLEKGQTSPVIMTKDNDGKVQIEFLDEKFKGKKVILDYTNDKKPTMTVVDESLVPFRPAEQPKIVAPVNGK